MLPTLSSLSVSFAPESRFRHRCSSRYLRISPLHLEFRSPLAYSSLAVSQALPELSSGLSLGTDQTACAPFTPSDSEQRLQPPYYRGCWHGVSRCLFRRYRQTGGISFSGGSSLRKELYDPKAFIAHAAWLDQAFAHCPIFPTAATRRCLGRVSVPVWPINLSARLPIAALVGYYPANKLMGGGLILRRSCEAPFFARTEVPATVCGISGRFQPLSPAEGQIIHLLRTRSPL